MTADLVLDGHRRLNLTATAAHLALAVLGLRLSSAFLSMPLGLIVGCGFWPFSRAISSRLSATSHFLDNAMLAVCHLTADPTATPNEPMVLTRSIAGLGRASRMIFLTIEGRRR